jgi:hypothetical protein
MKKCITLKLYMKIQQYKGVFKMIKQIARNIIIDDYGIRIIGNNKKPKDYKKKPLKSIDTFALKNANIYADFLETEVLKIPSGLYQEQKVIDSYHLKHLGEEFLRNSVMKNNKEDAYISNGAIIYAMVERGYDYVHSENETDVEFIVYLKDIEKY